MVENPSFEVDGGRAGSALAWHFVGKTTSREVLGFSGDNLISPITDPNDYTTASWLLMMATAAAGAATAPGGTALAQDVTDDAVSGAHGVAVNATFSLEEGESYTFGAYLRQGTLRYAGVLVSDGGPSEVVAFADLQDGKVASASGSGDLAAFDVDLVETEGGWFRFSASFRPAAFVASAFFGILLSQDGAAVAYVGSGESVSVWGAFVFSGDLDDAERFERGWLSNEDATPTVVDGVTAEYETDFATSAPRETFESAWSNRPVYSVMSLRESAVYGTTVPATEELFELDWPSPDPPEATTGAQDDAEFGGDPYEPFEADWRDNEDLLATLPFADSAIYSGSDDFEGFEYVQLDVAVSVDSSTDELLATSHGLIAGTPIYFVNVGGLYPGGVFRTIRYFVKAPTAHTFQIALTPLGAAVDITTDGAGSHLVRGDPTKFWNTLGFNATM